MSRNALHIHHSTGLDTAGEIPPRPPASVLTAQPVGVWRTYQTYEDYSACLERSVAHGVRGADPGCTRSPLLSVCMIVRDEERNLPSCLEAVRGLADEIVVVDTGSGDRTREIARSFGARVYESPWRADFAAPRNVAARHARGQWILAVDADEVAQPYSRSELQGLLADESVGAYYVLMRRRAGLTPNWHMRLYRNHPELRHTRSIHEGIVPEQVRAVTGKGLGRCRLLFHHSGYEGDLTHKHERNLPILKRLLASNPDHPDKAFIWGHLADIRIESGDDESGERAWMKGIHTLRKPSHLHPAHCSVYLSLMSHLAARGRSIGPILREADRLFPGNHQLKWIRGCRLVELGRFREAIKCFSELIDPGTGRNLDHWVGYDTRLFDELPAAMQDYCEFRLKVAD